jgi:putative isomerase
VAEIARELNITDVTRDPYMTLSQWMAQAPTAPPIPPGKEAALERAWATLWVDTEPAGGAWWKPVVTPGDVYNHGIWVWDSAFTALGLSHGGPAARQLALWEIDVMTSSENAQGLIPRELTRNGPLLLGQYGIQTPGILPLAANELYAAARSPAERAAVRANLAALYPLFARNDWWFSANTDRGRGLSGWTGVDSGWDNSPRWDHRVKEAIDLNCWLYLDRVQLAVMARTLGLNAQAAIWQQEANATAALVQAYMWDPALGVFNDTLANGSFSQVITPAIVMPLFVGIATPAQARSTIAYLVNPAELASPFGLTSVARSDPSFSATNYWRGPVWVNQNWIAVRALESYDFTALAANLRAETLNLVASNPVSYEYYNSLTGQGVGSRDYAWTAALSIDLALAP